MIIKATDTKKVQEIIDLITELEGDDLESLWEWFQSKGIVGGMLIDLS